MYIINVITLALCLSIVLIFRQLDKNSRSIDKVRKFSDKVKGEFELHFAKKKEELQNASVELDLKQSQSVAAVKRLEKIIEEFDAKTKTYENHISAVTQLEQRAGEYDTLIKTLFDMTERVEENLLRIKKESSVVDKVDAKLTEQRKTIDILEKKIPSIQNEFSIKNEAQLQQAVSGLLSSIQSDIAQIEHSTVNSLKKNDEILSAIKQSYETAFEQAAERADNLEHAAFDKLRNKAVERVEKYHQFLDEKTSSLSEIIKQKIDETQVLVKNFKNSWQQEASEYLNTMRMELQKTTEEYDEVTQKITENFSSFENETKDLSRRINEELFAGDDLLQKMRQKVESETNSLASLIHETSSSLESLADERAQYIQSLISTEIQSLKAFVEEETLQTKSRADTQLSETRALVENETAQVRKLVENETAQ
ncbi:MAG TPA: hypothetical protein PLU33_05330, partial [Treponemataceae bacterium]|nr:hypothetical protein [Treponemataceae bacterium]